jgi:TonB-linked SusC/RagA family outer membrane protein
MKSISPRILYPFLSNSSFNVLPKSIIMLFTKRLLIRLSVTLYVVLVAFTVHAQQVFSGVVKNQEGVPLPKATVTENKSKTTVLTNEQGEFTINAATGSVISVSYIGYDTRDITLDGTSSLNIQLQLAANGDLQQVVVVGYGTQQKRNLTGAVSVVDAKAVQNRQATTVAEALQGLASGVTVRGGGRPGQEAQIQIRGLKNFSNSNPLYVIDGLVTTANRDFNPNDIESIQILKDASAAAIYGSRAANGVIIITTKKGKAGPMRVDLSAKSSVQTTPRYKLADTEEFSRLNFMAYDNAGVPRQALALNVNTDWQDEAFQTGNMQDYNAGFSGGGTNGNYLMSVNYFGNKGTVISTNFDRISFRVNSSGSKGIFSIGENVAISNSKTDEISGNPYADVTRLLPTIPVLDPTHPGGYGYGDEAKARTFGTNPVAIAALEDRDNENLRIRGNIWSELKFTPWLKYRFNGGYESSSDHYKYLRKLGNWTLNQPADPAIADENRAKSQSILIENTLTFDKKFGKHSVNVVAGQTYQTDDYEFMFGRKRNIPQTSTGDYIDVLDQGNESVTGGYRLKANLISYLGRLDYNYDGRYLLNVVIRRDGTSRLSSQNQWGNFPSVSGAWRVSEESFFQSSVVNDLKIRASYGTLGSSNIGNWDYLATVNTFSTIAMGTSQTILPGATVVRLVNNDLKWERLTQQNFGVDATFLKNRLSLTAEYYIADTKDVLTGMPIAITTGNDGGNPVVNAASLRNTGFELSATWREDKGDFNYSANLNVTTLNNTVKKLGFGRTEIFSGNTITTLGEATGMWYVLETDGIFQTQAEVDNYKSRAGTVIQPTAKPGDIRYKDNDGNGQITNSDKRVVGSPWADIEVGLNLGASYKNFTFSMSWFGSYGATVYNGYYSLVDRFDDNSNYRKGIQPWTTANPNTKTPRAYYGTTLNSRGDTDRWLEDGSFTRLKFVSLSYSLPDNLLKPIGFSSAQISISGQNLITLTKYNGLDPEFANGNLFQRGVDNFSFPNLKTISAGIQLGF